MHKPRPSASQAKLFSSLESQEYGSGAGGTTSLFLNQKVIGIMTGSAQPDAQDLVLQPPFLDLASHSRFVQRLQRRYSELLPVLPAGAPTRESLTYTLGVLRERGLTLDAALRVLRQITLERLVQLDVEQQSPLPDVTRAMTWLAEVTLDAAWQQVQADQTPCTACLSRRPASVPSCGSSAWASWARASSMCRATST